MGDSSDSACSGLFTTVILIFSFESYVAVRSYEMKAAQETEMWPGLLRHDNLGRCSIALIAGIVVLILEVMAVHSGVNLNSAR